MTFLLNNPWGPHCIFIFTLLRYPNPIGYIPVAQSAFLQLCLKPILQIAKSTRMKLYLKYFVKTIVIGELKFGTSNWALYFNINLPEIVLIVLQDFPAALG